METERRIDEQATRRKGKPAARNRKEELGSVQEEGIDVQMTTTAVRRSCKREDGISEEMRKGIPPITDPKEAQKEVERLWAKFSLGLKNAALKEEEERRSWLSHLPEYRKGKKKVGKAERKNQPMIKEKAKSPEYRTGKEKLGEAELKNQPTIKEKEEVVGEPTEQRTIKETPPQDTKAAEDDYNSDPMSVKAQMFRDDWKAMHTGKFGSYEDITRIPPMKYTDRKPEFLHPMDTLQIFSVKIADIVGLAWPLDVFGMVVARDVLDHNRNIIFHRTRDNCQSISMQNPYLELTGPSRAVVVLDPVHLEVMLQVKGSVQSKDKDLSSLVVQFNGSTSQVHKRVCSSKLSTVELTFGGIRHSVEATISVQVVGGSWPDGFGGEFTANASSLDGMKIPLLAFGDGKLPVAADGMVKLSRRVVSVEYKGELRVSVKAVGEAVEKRDSRVFRAQKASRCKADVEVGSCKMTVTVAWSLLSSRQCFNFGPSA